MIKFVKMQLSGSETGSLKECRCVRRCVEYGCLDRGAYLSCVWRYFLTRSQVKGTTLLTKTVAPLSVMFVSQAVTIPEVAAAAGTHCAAMRAELESVGLASDAPFVFVAYGLPQDATTRFTLDICIPVVAPEHYHGAYAFKELNALECASLEVRGPIAQLFSHGYAPLMRQLEDGSAALSGESREVYWEWHDSESSANRIEVQIGLRAEGAIA
jgi:hypothetical protein